MKPFVPSIRFGELDTVLRAEIRLSLGQRFWLLILSFLLSSAVVVGLVFSLVLTPPVAARLVQLDEENRLYSLRGQAILPAGVNVVETRLLKSGEISVPLDTTRSLVSDRRPSLAESMKVIRPSKGRIGFGLALWLGLTYLLSRRLAQYVKKPLAELIEAQKAVADGHLDVVVNLPQEQELAQLTQSFNRMALRLKARDQDLEQALVAKERLFAATNHELRTPLTVILGYSQMLLEGLKGALNPDQAACQRIILRNAQDLLEQVEVLLTHSQLEAGLLPISKEPCDLRNVVEVLVGEFGPIAQERGLALVWENPDQAIVAEVDPKQARQIIRNLLDNAVKFTAEGQVTIRLTASSDRVEVQVQDTGPGVQVDFESQLFQEFSRGANSQGIQGTGLGLALSQRLARLMGGEIAWLKDRQPGATFAWSHPCRL